MDVFGKMIETYDNYQKAVSEGFVDSGIKMYPVGYTAKTIDLDITLDTDGNSTDIKYYMPKGKNVPEALECPLVHIPTFLNSRSGICPNPYPLTEKVQYMSDDFGKDRCGMYKDIMRKWLDFDSGVPAIGAILAYVEKGTILNDLHSHGILCNHDEPQEPKWKDKVSKLMVRWIVMGVEGGQDTLENKYIKGSFNRLFAYIADNECEKGLCCLTGEITGLADVTPGGLFPGMSSIFMLSKNNPGNYLGFSKGCPPVTVGKNAWAKVASVAEWLKANHGNRGYPVKPRQITYAWSTGGNIVDDMEAGTMGLFDEETPTPVSYHNEVDRYINGLKAHFPEGEKIIVVTAERIEDTDKGRSAFTNYMECTAEELAETVHDWFENTAWYFRYRSESGDMKTIIRTPSVYEIAAYAFGREDKGRLVTDGRIVASWASRLTDCVYSRKPIPYQVIKALVNSVIHKDRWSKFMYMNLLSVACAAIRNYIYYDKEEDHKMKLNVTSTDRSYQTGRIIALLEKAEIDATGHTSTVTERMMNKICNIPFETISFIEKKFMTVYYGKLTPGLKGWYKKEIQDAIASIELKPGESMDDPLTPQWVLGYSLQNKYLYTPKEERDNAVG